MKTHNEQIQCPNGLENNAHNDDTHSLKKEHTINTMYYIESIFIYNTLPALRCVLEAFARSYWIRAGIDLQELVLN